MTSIYYRLSDGSLHALTDEEYAGCQANGKADGLRVWVPTEQPIPPAGQKAIAAAPVIDSVNAVQTWQLVLISSGEQARAAAATELAPELLQAAIERLTTFIQADRTGLTAAQFRSAIDDQVVMLSRIVRNYLRSMS